MGKIFKFWGEEVDIRKNINSLNKYFWKWKKEFYSNVEDSKKVKLFYDLLTKLKLQDKKWCYNEKLVDDVLNVLAEKWIWLENKYDILILNVRQYLKNNLLWLRNIILLMDLEKKEDVEELWNILKDHSISEIWLIDIVEALLWKKEFVYLKMYNYEYIFNLIKLHPSFTDNVLSKILFYEWRKQIINWSKGWYMKQKTADTIVYKDELELMKLKNYFIIVAKDLRPYKKELLWKGYIKIILEVCKNKFISLEDKKIFLSKLSFDIIERLEIPLKDTLDISKEEKDRIILFLGIIKNIKNPNSRDFLIEKLLDKQYLYNRSFINILKESFETKVELTTNEEKALTYINEVLMKKKIF